MKNTQNLIFYKKGYTRVVQKVTLYYLFKFYYAM